MTSISTLWGVINEETPKYEVIKKTSEGYEIRKYAPQIVAKAGNSSLTTGDGFGVIAKYIFGNNTKKESIAMTAPVQTSEKIAMTAPVVTQEAEMSFVLPSKYTEIDQLPTPNDDRVKLVKVPEQTFIVAQFSWTATDKAVATKVEALTKSVEADQSVEVDKSRSHFLARFNPPWTLPMFRTNEVGVPVTFRQAEQ